MESLVLLLSGAEHLKVTSHIRFENGKFKNKETSLRLLDHVRYQHVIIIQSFPTPNDDLMQLVFAMDACKRAGAASVTVLLPIFPYARQDKKHKAGAPISAKAVADIIGLYADRIITFDLHNDTIQGFLGPDVVFDHIKLTAFLAAGIRDQILPSLTAPAMVAPDAGAAKRVAELASLLSIPDLVFCSKVRTQANVVDKITVIGDVRDRDCILFDDMLDTGGTLALTMSELMSKGARSCTLIVSHLIASAPARQVLRDARIFCTNSMPVEEADPTGEAFQNLTILPLEPFISALIQLINAGLPLGKLFRRWPIDG